MAQLVLVNLMLVNLLLVNLVAERWQGNLSGIVKIRFNWSYIMKLTVELDGSSTVDQRYRVMTHHPVTGISPNIPAVV